jgi:hypothetical protein
MEAKDIYLSNSETRSLEILDSHTVINFIIFDIGSFIVVLGAREWILLAGLGYSRHICQTTWDYNLNAHILFS